MVVKEVGNEVMEMDEEKVVELNWEAIVFYSLTFITDDEEEVDEEEEDEEINEEEVE